MAGQKLTNLAAVQPTLDDLVYIVDVSDTSDSATGMSKKATLSNLLVPMDFGTVLINSTGDFAVSGLGFRPRRLKLEAAPPVDSTDMETAGPKNGNEEDNWSGVMVGFAKNDSGGTVQQAISSGQGASSTNATRSIASSSLAFAVSYANTNGGEVGQISGTLKSWDSDGFTLNANTFSGITNLNGLLLIWTAWR